MEAVLSAAQVGELQSQGRTVALASPGDPSLGPLALLPGRWANLPNLPGHGWNMIALPFAGAGPLNYRLLLNQFNEELVFSVVDKGVANRGIDQADPAVEKDQFLAALDYDQIIVQIAGADSSQSSLIPANDAVIHREPGLWLHLANQIEDGVDLARLATTPHGDAVMALGTSAVVNGPPSIPMIGGLPIGPSPNIDLNLYLAPYKQFHDHPFQGVFDPVTPNARLVAANQGVNIIKTTVLNVDTTVSTGGINNIPFVAKQANATAMKATFWIQELAEQDAAGNPKLRLQYQQIVLLDFFPKPGDTGGLIRWPHISINTLEKVA